MTGADWLARRGDVAIDDDGRVWLRTEDWQGNLDWDCVGPLQWLDEACVPPASRRDLALAESDYRDAMRDDYAGQVRGDWASAKGF